ncbi:MAG TPA: MIP/aquaporin family protein [Rhizomicrobium sp.]|jgi:glycerol uptake facilitator-like aquaporin|nr:MIP/aquaporin family protein [Rhizomicrobium sp.]
MTSQAPELRRALVAEALGTGLLVAGVVGSGIMARDLTHDAALALLCNALATGAILTVLILALAPVSGAHFNPAVTLAFALRSELPWKRAALYSAAQFAGGIAGTWLAHAMFALPVLALGTTSRGGPSLWLSECVATSGLLLAIFASRERGERVVAPIVGLYIAAAYWFTASTAFANPAVTLARALTPTFSGIRPLDAPLFVMAQLIAVPLAAFGAAWLFDTAEPVVRG